MTELEDLERVAELNIDIAADNKDYDLGVEPGKVRKLLVKVKQIYFSWKAPK